MTKSNLRRALEALDGAQTLQIEGKVRSFVGLAIRASVPGVRIGEIVSKPWNPLQHDSNFTVIIQRL